MSGFWSQLSDGMVGGRDSIYRYDTENLFLLVNFFQIILTYITYK